MAKRLGSMLDMVKPSPGRLYDYFLGGHHNFMIDRVVANQLIRLVPVIPKWARMTRWFLHEAVGILVDEGFDKFLDFASGLPTGDHIHELTPVGTKVIYSDIDSVTVRYGRDIIGDNPNIRFELCDASHPEELLSSPVMELFGGDRHVAIGFNAIDFSLTDEQLAHAARTFYDWAAPGSRLFTSLRVLSSEGLSPQEQQVFDMYARMGNELYFRPLERGQELLAPWESDERGFMPVEEWLSPFLMGTG
ncbi:MAG: SAM-dependent methyltransferase [Chloroflexota bacterium]|nr:SAM-dependent methyltransferase [Chloroflexota bacterium]